MGNYLPIIFGEHRDSDLASLPNVHLGVSIESRAYLHRIDALLETPAALRFLSLEPLLEDLGTLDLHGIGWVIVGGESGPGAAAMGFTVAGPYLNLKSFIADLTKSLRLVDVASLSMAAGEAGYTYSFEVKTYWLK